MGSNSFSGGWIADLVMEEKDGFFQLLEISINLTLWFLPKNKLKKAISYLGFLVHFKTCVDSCGLVGV